MSKVDKTVSFGNTVIILSDDNERDSDVRLNFNNACHYYTNPKCRDRYA